MSSSKENTPKTISVLFVCLGNICRSPMAEAYFGFLVEKEYPDYELSRLDSAGTSDWHIGSKPDSRTLSTLRSKGILSYTHVARQITASDFFDFDYIFAMDRSNLQALREMQGNAIKHKATLGKSGRKLGEVRLFGEGRGGDEEVGDPYYGEGEGFKECFTQVERFARGFVDQDCGWKRAKCDSKRKEEI